MSADGIALGRPDIMELVENLEKRLRWDSIVLLAMEQLVEIRMESLCY
jgi:hypothetical protein